MQVSFTATSTINGHDVAEADGGRDYAVTVDGALWGWVSGPAKGQRVSGNCWVALKVGAAFWGDWSRNREAAVLSAL